MRKWILLLSAFLVVSCAVPSEKKPITPEEQEKINSLLKEIEIFPEDDLSFQALGVFFFEKNETEKSLKYLEKAVAVNLKNFEALAWLGAAKAKKGGEISGIFSMGRKKIALAKEGYLDVVEALRNEPENPVIHLVYLALISEFQNRFSFGKKKDAVNSFQFFEESLNNNPSIFPKEIMIDYDIYKNKINAMEEE